MPFGHIRVVPSVSVVPAILRDSIHTKLKCIVVGSLNQQYFRTENEQLGDFRLELFEYSSPTPRESDANRPVCDHGLTHFSFEVTDVQAVYDRLKKAGMRFHCPPEKLGDLGTATYGRDPDGNVIELAGQP